MVRLLSTISFARNYSTQISRIWISGIFGLVGFFGVQNLMYVVIYFILEGCFKLGVKIRVIFSESRGQIGF